MAGRLAEQAAGGLPPGFAIHNPPQEFTAEPLSFTEGCGIADSRPWAWVIMSGAPVVVRRPARRHNKI